MLRVGDLQRSIDFYTRVLGMTLLRTTERPEQKYSLALVGSGTTQEAAELELTDNHGHHRHEGGTAAGHTAPRSSSSPCNASPHPVAPLNDPRRAHPRLASPRHRRTARMRVLPFKHKVVPALPLAASDHAYGLALFLKYRPLLNVRLEIGAYG